MYKPRFYLFLTVVAIVSLITSCGCISSGNGDVYKGAVAVWDMDEMESDIIYDKSGRNNSAAAFDTTTIDGVSGKARRFNGTSSFIHTQMDFSTWTNFTISFWCVVVPQVGEMGVVLDTGHTNEDNFVVQTTPSSNLVAEMTGSGGGEAFWWYCNGKGAVFKVPYNEWTHVVVSHDAANKRLLLYVNGEGYPEIPLAKVGGFGPAPLTFGRLSNSWERYFKGAIDEVAIWDRVLTEKEVKSLYLSKRNSSFFRRLFGG